MFSIFARPKPCKILILLRDEKTPWHLSKLATQSSSTYVYATKLLTNLEKLGIVSLESKGKKRLVRLTEKGSEIAKLLEDLASKLK